MFDAPVIQFIALAVLGVVAGKLLYKGDTAREERRRQAIEVASVARGYGLEKIPDLLIAYAVGDYSGIAFALKGAAKLALSEKDLLAEFDAAFYKVLAKKLETVEGQKELEAKLAGSKKEIESKAAAPAAS